MNELKIFNFNENKVRISLANNNEPLFCLVDVCKALDITNSRNVTSSLFNSGVYTMDVAFERSASRLTFVNEPNLYRVIFKSRKAAAIKFQNWVCEEVLPSIRKTGKYSIVDSDSDKIEDIVKDAVNKVVSGITKAITDSILSKTNLQPVKLPIIEYKEEYLTPTDLGKLLNKSANEVNITLELLKLQSVKFDNLGRKRWEVTPEGFRFAKIIKIGEVGATKFPVYQIKWNVKKIKEILGDSL